MRTQHRARSLGAWLLAASVLVGCEAVLNTSALEDRTSDASTGSDVGSSSGGDASSDGDDASFASDGPASSDGPVDAGPDARVDASDGSTDGGCSATSQCSSGPACTVPSCVSGACIYSQASNGSSCALAGGGGNGFCNNGSCQSGCDIQSVIFSYGQLCPWNSCQACQPGNSTGWTLLSAGTPCNADGGSGACDTSGTCVVNDGG